MLRNIMVSGTVALLLSVATLSSKAQEKREPLPFLTNEAFEAFSGTFRTNPDLTEEEFLGMLRDEGFQQNPALKSIWFKDDQMGRLRISRYRGAAFVTYFPAVAQPTPAPVLAALIAKAVSINLINGDTVEVLLTSRQLSERTSSLKGGRQGTLSQYLEFSLLDGHLVKTSNSIEWNDAK